MKIIRKILCGIAVLLAIVCLFIILCAFRPDITERIRGLLYHDRSGDVSAQIALDSGNDTEAYGIVPVQAADSVDDARLSGGNADFESPEAGRGLEDEAGEILKENKADYIQPDESEIIIPGHVAGRGGYMQVQDDAQQVDDSVAGDIRSRIDAGYTGDGLDFDAVLYPYYAMLDDRGKHIYRQIYANANEIYPVFMPVEDVTVKQLRNIFAAVYNDHPELFWLETAYSCKYMRTGQCVEIDLEFNRTAQELDSAKVDFNNQVNSIVTGAQNIADEYGKEKFVHDELLDRVSYSTHAEMNQSAYSALVNGQTVCAGYARAFQYILQQLGIPCYYCTGFAGESHAWNIVALDDGYYNVDTTWDDSDGGNYDYFNKTDEDYASSHIRQELSVYLPPCNGQAYRNLEQDAQGPQNELRSLADAGMTEEQVFTDLNGYYGDCYNQIIQRGRGHYVFSNVIQGEPLLEEWRQGYDSDSYKQAYMDHAMKAVEAYHCFIEMEVEELQGGMYLVTHEVSLTE